MTARLLGTCADSPSTEKHAGSVVAQRIETRASLSFLRVDLSLLRKADRIFSVLVPMVQVLRNFRFAAFRSDPNSRAACHFCKWICCFVGDIDSERRFGGCCGTAARISSVLVRIVQVLRNLLDDMVQRIQTRASLVIFAVDVGEIDSEYKFGCCCARRAASFWYLCG